MDDFSTGRASNLANLAGSSNFTLIEGSILDTQVLDSVISDTEYVFHLAAAVGVFNIVNNPLASLLTNIRGTENILEAAHKTKTQFFSPVVAKCMEKIFQTPSKKVMIVFLEVL